MSVSAGSSGRPEILFVIGALDVGGTEHHLAMLAPRLARLGWDVSVYSLAGSGTVQGEFERNNIRVILPPLERKGASRLLPFRLGRLLATAVHLLFVMLRRRPAIVHFFLPAAYLVGAPLAVLARVPVRLMSRRSLNAYQEAYPLLRRAERFCHRTMDAVLGNSASVTRQLAGEGVLKERLGLIYNGIDLSRFETSPPKSALRKAHGFSPDALLLCIVANLIPYKGHRDLVDALGLAAPDLPPGWRLLIVGRDDGIGEDLRKLAAQRGIGENIVFLGVRSDVPELFGMSDIGLSCSHEEGFSNAVLEGMATGLAMIVTDVGGNPEAVAGGACGLVVQPKDPPGLAQAIRRLAADGELRARFGAAARRRVADRFALEACVDRYDATYRSLIERGTLPPAVRVEN